VRFKSSTRFLILFFFFFLNPRGKRTQPGSPAGWAGCGSSSPGERHRSMPAEWQRSAAEVYVPVSSVSRALEHPVSPPRQGGGRCWGTWDGGQRGCSNHSHGGGRQRHGAWPGERTRAWPSASSVLGRRREGRTPNPLRTNIKQINAINAGLMGDCNKQAWGVLNGADSH